MLSFFLVKVLLIFPLLLRHLLILGLQFRVVFLFDLFHLLLILSFSLRHLFLQILDILLQTLYILPILIMLGPVLVCILPDLLSQVGNMIL